MTDVQDVLRAQFETALTRAPHGGALDKVLRRGITLGRVRKTSYLIAGVAVGAALAAVVPVASRLATAERAIQPGAPGRVAPQGVAAPSMELTARDRAGLAAIDAVHMALDIPRADLRYPYYSGVREGASGTWDASFHLMSCSGFEDCEGAGDLITIRVEVDGTAARVSSITGAVSQEERDALLGYRSSDAAGERRFHISSSWLREDGEGGGVAVGSYAWQGAIPTYGYLYRCSAKVFDASGKILYEGTEHPVPLPAPDQEELRSGLVGIPVPLHDEATTTEVTCNQEESVPVPGHIRGMHSGG
jgi:hypothetical protein